MGIPAILEVLSTEAAIENVIGKPSSKVLAKVLNSLDDICRAFIARSPFVVVASSDSAGNLDVSPKGDPPGFVYVLDDRTIAIPERPGKPACRHLSECAAEPQSRVDFRGARQG